MPLLLLMFNLCILESFSLPAPPKREMEGDSLGAILINETIILPTIRSVGHSIHSIPKPFI